MDDGTAVAEDTVKGDRATEEPGGELETPEKLAEETGVDEQADEKVPIQGKTKDSEKKKRQRGKTS